VLEEGRQCAEVPVAALTECAPAYDWPAEPAPVAAPAEPARDALARLGDVNVCSRRWVYRQYDETIQAATAATDDADAALVLLPGGKRAIALCTDGNFDIDDPYLAGALAVAEAARNVSCTGATPIALTNCLNLGSPERPAGSWQLREVIRGLADASRALAVPVISGNVSLYNESDGGAIRPTPIVGMLGLLEDVTVATRIGFRRAGDAILLLGPPFGTLDLSQEAAVQRSLREAIARGLVHSAHDCSTGGLFVALAECCLKGDIGATMDSQHLDFFAESPSRVVVSTQSPEALLNLDVPSTRLGTVGGSRLTIPGVCDLALEEMAAAYEGGLARALGAKA
jgi:phosphoribosylformylglycinamidine synthase